MTYIEGNNQKAQLRTVKEKVEKTGECEKVMWHNCRYLVTVMGGKYKEAILIFSEV